MKKADFQRLLTFQFPELGTPGVRIVGISFRNIAKESLYPVSQKPDTCSKTETRTVRLRKKMKGGEEGKGKLWN